ncbi:hypothetical protein KKC1_22760 [Calderihabitans maritimus]|uniref:Uncharacterized protein n=1 Tax=Calderihabitans maritimus TaxID=1246530 RepID=A0A1Z5HUX7_9FIRM|nr:hypothetical protein KKC1_22760 [Calderihabitans maritimus]
MLGAPDFLQELVQKLLKEKKKEEEKPNEYEAKNCSDNYVVAELGPDIQYCNSFRCHL